MPPMIPPTLYPLAPFFSLYFKSWHLLRPHFKLHIFTPIPLAPHIFLRILGWDPWGGNTVTSHNTHKQLLISSGPFQIPVTTFATSTQLLRFLESCLCLNLVVINSWPWTLSIVKSPSCFSPTLPPWALYLCKLCLAVFLTHTLFTPAVMSECTALLGWKLGVRGVLDSGFSLCTVPTYYCRSEYFYNQCPQVQNLIRSECRVKSKAS